MEKQNVKESFKKRMLEILIDSSIDTNQDFGLCRRYDMEQFYRLRLNNGSKLTDTQEYLYTELMYYYKALKQSEEENS